MSGVNPVETLEAEHRVIQRVVAVMVVLADQLEAGGGADPAVLERIVEFLRTFADRSHHGKEEAWFFPAMERRGVPAHGCPLGGLTMEHAKGRLLVGEFAEAIEAWKTDMKAAAAREALVKTLRVLATFYPAHIWKEDYLLFPLAGRLLTQEDRQELSARFEAVDREIGQEVYARLEHLAEELDAQVRIGETL
jgi:hemerythrin-like domain-containing protein